MRPRRRSTDWLSVTPEPERLLPGAVAALRGGSTSVEGERRAIERLVRRGRLRDWLAYRDRALELAGRNEDPQLADAADLTVEVIDNHDNLLRGLE
jgi:hypothetical protein